MKPADAILDWFQDTRGPDGAFGREGGQTGFAYTGSEFYSITEAAEWDALSRATQANEDANMQQDYCECCGPDLTEEGRKIDAKIRAELLPAWYRRRHRATLRSPYAR